MIPCGAWRRCARAFTSPPESPRAVGRASVCSELSLAHGGLRAAARRPRRALAAALLALPLLAGLAPAAQAQECTTATDGAYTVPADWALIPSGVTSGKKFRLLFVTSTQRKPDVTAIATYDTHVQNAAKAGHSAISDSCGNRFKVLGSTPSVDARDHTGTTYTSSDKGVPIYWLDGAKAADDYEDFYDNSWDSYGGKNESGDGTAATFIATGSNNNGTKHATRRLGSGQVQYGRLRSGDMLNAGSSPSQGQRHFYALSPVFLVGSHTVSMRLESTGGYEGDGSDPQSHRVTFSTSPAWDGTPAIFEVNLCATGTATLHSTDGTNDWELVNERGQAYAFHIDDGCYTGGLPFPRAVNDDEWFIRPKGDTRAEPDETAILTLTRRSDTPAGVAISGTAGTATFTIYDDEGDYPVASFASAAGTIAEGGGTHTVRLNLSKASATDLTIGYVLGGTATAGSDYTAPSGTVTLTAGATTADIAVAVTNDTDAEGDETVVLTLSAGSGYLFGATTEHTLTITDDEALPGCAAANAGGAYPVPTGWALKPSAVALNGKFRLLFVTSTTRNGESAAIADYNAFVRTAAKAGHPALADGCGDRFVAVASTPTVDARDNTDMWDATASMGAGDHKDAGAAVPIYWLDGARLADDYADFYDGNWDDYGAADDRTTVLTGSDNDGTAHATESLGSPTTGLNAVARTGYPADGRTLNNSNQRQSIGEEFYALSPVFEVSNVVVASHTLSMSVAATADEGDIGSPGYTDHEITFTVAPAYANTFDIGVCLTGTATWGPGNDYELVDVGDGDLAFATVGGRLCANTPGRQWPISSVHRYYLRVHGDTVVEDDETVTLTLEKVTGGSTPTPADVTISTTAGSATHTIANDDAPKVNLSVSGGGAITEGGAALTITATRDTNNTSGGPLVIPIGVKTADTDAQSNDYTVVTSISIANNMASGTTGFAVTDDGADEADETVVIELGTLPSGSDPGANDEVEITITDNDATAVTLTGAAGDVTEGGTKTFTVTLGRGLVNGEALDVPLVFGGTATRNGDYTTACPNTPPTGVACYDLNNTNAGNKPRVTFTGPATGATATTVTLTLSAATDSAGEGGETVDIDLGALDGNSGTNLDGGASGTDTLAEFDIDDPANQALTLSAGTLSVTEGAAGTFTVRLSSQPTGTVTVAVASNNADVTAAPSTLTFNPTGTDLWSAAQTVTVSAAQDMDAADEGAALTLSASGGGYGAVSAAVTVTVFDDEAPPAGLATTGASHDLPEGAARWFNLFFTDSNNLLAAGEAATYRIVLGGTAGRADYVLGCGASVSCGGLDGAAPAVTVTRGLVDDDGRNYGSALSVTAVEDNAAESRETLTLRLNDPSAGVAFGIVDSPTATTVGFTSGTQLVTERAAQAAVLMRVNPPVGRDLTIPVTVTAGTATEGEDYDAFSSLPLPAGVAVTGVSLPIVPDSVDEDDETVIIAIDTANLPANVTAGAITTATVTIRDDDERGLDIAGGPLTVPEGGSGAFTVRLASQPTGAVTVAVASDDTDVTPTPASLTFNATGATNLWSAARTVTVAAAAGSDGDTATVTLTASGADYGAETGTVAVTVGPGGDPLVSITGGSAVAEGTAAAFTLHADPPFSGTTIVSIGVADAPGADFLEAGVGGVEGDNGVQVFPSGQATYDFTIATTVDNVAEPSGPVRVTVRSRSPVQYAVGDPNSAVVVVNDNDGGAMAKPLAAFAAGSSGAGESAATHNVRVNFTPALPAGITLTYTVGGTADADADYAALAGTLNVAANATHADIPVAVLHDTAVEDAETVILTLSEGTGYARGGRIEHVFTIADDDDGTPEANFQLSASSRAEESAGAHNVRVELSPSPPSPVTLNYAVTGTATSGTDFGTLTGTAAAAANATHVLIPVSVTDDADDDGGETVILTLRPGSGYTVGSRSVHTLTITDDDAPPVASFARAARSAAENASASTVSIVLSKQPAATVTVTYAVTGTADADADYEALTGSVDIESNRTSRSFPVRITDDVDVEGAETVILTLTAGTGYTIGSPGVHTLTITDNDGGVTNNAPAFAAGTAARSVAENAAAGTNVGAVIPAATDADGDTLTYSMGGTDAASFAFDTSTRQITTRAGVTYDHEATSSHTVTVTASDGTDSDAVTVTITVTDVAEPPAAPAAPGVTATSGSTTGLDVSWSAPANAGRPAIESYDVQYRAGTSGAFGNGPQNVTGTSTALTGLTANTSYQVRVRATNAEGDSPWSAPGSGTTGNTTPQANFAAAASTAGEASGTQNVRVNFSPTPGSGFTLNYAVGGSATAGTDFGTLPGTVAVTANAAHVDIPVAITNDTNEENDETVMLTLRPGSGYTVGPSRRHTLTIQDNDGTPTARFAGTAGRADEDGGTANARVLFSPAPQSGITLNYGVGGTATAGTDFGTLSGTVSVSSGATAVNIAVAITDDAAEEGTETVILTLTDGSGYAVGAPGAYTLSIDDDEVGLEITTQTAPRRVFVDEGGPAGSYDVELLAAPTGAVTVTVTSESPAVALVNAAGGQPGTRATLTFGTANWSDAQAVTVTPRSDSDADDETAVITHAVSGPGVYANLPDYTVLVLVDDDDTGGGGGGGGGGGRGVCDRVDLVVENLEVEEPDGKTSIRIRLPYNDPPFDTSTIVRCAAVSINYTTEDGSALSGEDYEARSGDIELLSAGGRTEGYGEATLEIPILNDARYEPDEAFTLKLEIDPNDNRSWSRSNLPIVDDKGYPVTILSDDPPSFYVPAEPQPAWEYVE